MRALVATGPGQLSVEDVPDPRAPDPGRVLVRSRVTAVSVGTELRMLYEPRAPHAPDPEWPMVGAFGYLAAGEVIAVGAQVTDISVGDRVACGRTWGAHRELLDVDAALVQQLPTETSYLEGACAYWAVPPLCGIIAGAPRFNDDVAVIGLGPLGLAAVQMLVPFCRRVVAVDRIATRCGLAAEFGASAVDSSVTDAATEVRRLLPDGPAVVLQAAGSQASLELALAVVRQKGTVANVGTLPALSGFDLFWPMQMSGAKLVPIHRLDTNDGSDGALGIGLRQKYLPEVLEMTARGRLDIARLCTWALPLESSPRALPFLRDHPASGLGLAFAWTDDDVAGVDAFETAVAQLS
jgi:threonine dehydrogenase-like Zn-dependent dehydrogenase